MVEIVDVDAKHLPQQGVQVLSVLIGIVAAAAIAHADVEDGAAIRRVGKGFELELAAIVVAGILRNCCHDQAGAWVDQVGVYADRIALNTTVSRGEVIGRNGSTGKAGGVNHVHFELVRDGRPHPDGWSTKDLANPMDYLDGCFDPAKSYPTDRFVLTYPIACESK